MLDSRQAQNRVVISRQPRASTTVDRRKVAMPMMNGGIMTKKNEIVIKRAAQSTKMQEEKQQVEQKQMAQRQMMQKQMMQKQMMQKQLAQKQMSQNAETETQTKAKAQAEAHMGPTAKELKASAIEKALASAAKSEPKTKDNISHIHFGLKRILLALVCSAAAVFAIVYFVNLNAPNITLKVAAMQTGIGASYPTYVPRDYNLSDISSENGKITLNFRNGSTGDSFSLVEEKSSWDTNALLNNFVRKEFDNDYTTIKEQGLTIYISNSDAAWVNGGIMYKLKYPSNSLTKKQIKSIAVSL